MTPTIENGTVPLKMLPHAQKRPREYLTPAEVEELISVAKKRGRYGQRDATMILLAYRHGLRVVISTLFSSSSHAQARLWVQVSQ